ncbi:MULTISPECIES: EF-hand domain-containing protein [unclassified Cupriavidus]|uniref:EF-hand domain-containing protein n=1 Tax=unclassified Cupriavidus TaxID=2640874 RepID=UPI003F9272E8
MVRLNFLVTALALSITLANSAVIAQPSQQTTPSTSSATTDVNEVPQPPKGMTPAERKKWFSERFREADVDHDGKLTREEARAGMPEVYKRFDQLDTRKRGYVTERQVGAAWSKLIKDDMQKKNPIIN